MQILTREFSEHCCHKTKCFCSCHIPAGRQALSFLVFYLCTWINDSNYWFLRRTDCWFSSPIELFFLNKIIKAISYSVHSINNFLIYNQFTKILRRLWEAPQGEKRRTQCRGKRYVYLRLTTSYGMVCLERGYDPLPSSNQGGILGFIELLRSPDMNNVELYQIFCFKII